jgi:hypothetical protein
MNAVRMVGILLIVGGGLGLAYGGFSYTKERHTAELGPLQLEVREQEHVNVPVWAGLGAIVVGVVLLASSRSS